MKVLGLNFENNNVILDTCGKKIQTKIDKKFRNRQKWTKINKNRQKQILKILIAFYTMVINQNIK